MLQNGLLLIIHEDGEVVAEIELLVPLWAGAAGRSKSFSQEYKD